MVDSPKKYISLFIKCLIAALLIYTVYQQLFLKHNFEKLYNQFCDNARDRNSFYLILTFILMIPNWFLETLRWRFLVIQHHPITIRMSIRAILMGITLGMISPQRVGEYAGRLLVLTKDKNWLSVKSNFLTSLSLNIVILIFGLFSLFILADDGNLIFNLSVNGVLISGTISLFILVLVFFSLKKIERIFKLHIVFEKIKSWGSFTAYQFSKRSLFILLVFSLARYIVFLCQYALLLTYFGARIESMTLLACVALVYLIQSILPLPSMLSLLARGEIAIMVFSVLNVNEISILATTFGLWIINLMLPAFFGLILLMKTTILEPNRIENNQ